MSIADKADFVRRVFQRYGVLVDFEGDVPATLAQRLAEKQATRETFGQFCLRVLGQKHDQVVVLTEGSFPGQKQLASVKLDGAAAVLAKAFKPTAAKPKAKKRAVKPSETEVTAVKQAKALERRVKKLEGELARAEGDLAKMRAVRQRQTYSTRSIDALVDKLDDYLKSQVPVDDLVAKKVHAVIKALEEDMQLCDAVWPLVTMTDKVVELKRKAEDERDQFRAMLDKPQAEAA